MSWEVDSLKEAALFAKMAKKLADEVAVHTTSAKTQKHARDANNTLDKAMEEIGLAQLNVLVVTGE